MILQEQKKQEIERIYSSYLLVSKGSQLTHDKLLNLIPSMFLTMMHTEIYISEFRHVAEFLMHDFVKERRIQINNPRNVVLGAGHSVETAMQHYALSAEAIDNSKREEYDVFRQISDIWQVLIGLAPDTLPQTAQSTQCNSNNSNTTLDEATFRKLISEEVLKSEKAVRRDLNLVVTEIKSTVASSNQTSSLGILFIRILIYPQLL
jgi:hypothetical protein